MRSAAYAIVQCLYYTFIVPKQVNMSSNFFPRYAMHKRGLCHHAVSVCLRVSVTFMDHIKTNNAIFEFFSPSGSHTILVFPCQTA